ncbi:hypothetical protein [Cupriavidus campinensis]
MAVDFTLLPSEAVEPVDRPSWLLWSLACLAVAIAAGVAVLLLWPPHLPTNTGKFWVTLFLFPVGIPALVLLRRLSHHEGRALDARLRSEAARTYNQRVFALASRPMLVGASAYRFSADATQNRAASVRAGDVALEMQTPLVAGHDPVKARWLELPPSVIGKVHDDDARQQGTATWLISELLDDVAAAVRALPPRLPLKVFLWADGQLDRARLETIWRDSWDARQLPAMHVEAETEPAGIGIVDQWLDRSARGEPAVARLIAILQLRPVLNAAPPPGSAEAGVAVLLCPQDAMPQEMAAPLARLHRPVRGAFDRIDVDVSQALRWGGMTDVPPSGGWQTGMDASQGAGVLLGAQAIGKMIDMDPSIGRTGIAAPWLALACAAASLGDGVDSQLVVVADAEAVDYAVIRRAASLPPGKPIPRG